MSKYRIPIDFKKSKHYFWGYTLYEYKLYSDDTEKNHARLKFVDIDGFMIGFHLPTEFTSTYVKKAEQARSSAKKVIEDVRMVSGAAAMHAVNVGSEIGTDAAKFAKETGQKTVSILSKVKGIFRRKASNESSSV